MPTPVLALSLMMRLRSRQEDSFSAKVVAALRHGFGGHVVSPLAEAPAPIAEKEAAIAEVPDHE